MLEISYLNGHVQRKNLVTFVDFRLSQGSNILQVRWKSFVMCGIPIIRWKSVHICQVIIKDNFFFRVLMHGPSFHKTSNSLHKLPVYFVQNCFYIISTQIR